MANNYTYNTVTVGTSATKILSANANRQGFIITNESGNRMYIGPDDSITTSNTISIPNNGVFTMSNDMEMFRGDIYGIVSSGSVDIRYWEWGIQ